jgi:hypothetical protein
MDSEARLMRALAADRPPAVDPGFALGVMRAAEAERFRREALALGLRAAGLGAAAAALAVPLLGWAAAHAEALQSGLVGAAGLVTLVWIAHLARQRVTAA